MITFDEFMKADLRVAEIKSAEDHPNADKLFVLRIDMGEEERQLVAGLRGHYTAEELIGKKIIVVANLEPVKLRGMISQGMLLAAGDGETVSLLTLDKDAPAGSAIS